MDYTTILAFAIGVIIVGVFYIIKSRNLIKADRIASQLIATVNAVVERYSDEIKEYDRENGTQYYEEITGIVEKIKKLEEDDEITPIEFALAVIELREDIERILKTLNLFDKVSKIKE